jgi:hypothetical protein
MKKPSQEVQSKVIAYVAQKFSDYDTLLSFHRTKWQELYKATYIFETERNKPGQSTIFIPKCFEQVEKVAPRIFGNKPKFVIGLASPINYQSPEANMALMSQAAQKGLNYFWKVGGGQKKARIWVKSGLVYGVSWAKATIERKTAKRKEEQVIEKNGELIVREVETETIISEYPTFVPIDIFDIYFDPRIQDECDRDAIIENVDQVRIQDLKLQKDIYFNLGELDALGGDAYSLDGSQDKLQRFQMHGIPNANEKTTDKINIKNYYGYFSETDKPEDAKIIFATIAENSVVIRYEEIDFIPFEKFIPTDIPGIGVGVGLVEPIKKIQDGYNLTRNQRMENVSLVLNRMWLMKQGGGIDPRRLRSQAGNVIAVKDMADIQPLATPDVTASSYNETQALNTEIQTTLGTIDTSQEAGQNGFTNLATGQKIRWNEFNVRFKAIKENFEEALAKLGEKLLRVVGKHATQNPLIQDEYTGIFYEIAKQAFDSPQDFYNVSVIADSTAYDSTENQRDQALALGQLAIAYKAQGINVNMEKIFEDILRSFPSINPQEYLLPPAPEQPQQNAPNSIPQSTIDQAKVQPTPEDALNNQLTNV